MDVKEAGVLAERYLTKLLGNVGSITLEEVELSENERYWLITLSYREMAVGRKEYKIFKIDSASGKVISMKIRTLQ